MSGGSVPFRYESVSCLCEGVPSLSGRWSGPVVLLRDRVRERGCEGGGIQRPSIGPLKR